MQYVFAFDHKHRRPPMDMKDLLGGKGANLAEMTSVLGLPVPPGFTITTDACRAYMGAGWPDGLDDEIAKHVKALEKAMGKRLGDPADPLLVSVRSGAKFSMPGMMDTVLNLGLNDESVEGLAKQTDDERFAHDLGTAVNVQTMVFGNRDDNSGTGVGFTRDPATGEKGAYGDFLVNAQGEDVVAGIRNTDPLSALDERFPKIYKELMQIFERLEKHYRDM